MTSQCLLHLNFFVPQLSEYNTVEENNKIRDFRLANFNAILKEQFQLAYHGHIEYDASDQMTVLERHTMYKILVDQKSEEKRSHDEALKAAEAKRKSTSWRRKK